MKIAVRRVYAPRDESEGVSILVDRLWPRGISKDRAPFDRWMRDIAPSDGLRKTFHAKSERWHEFCEAYFQELEDRPELVAELIELGEETTLTLMFAARDETRNNAMALKDYLLRRGHKRR